MQFQLESGDIQPHFYINVADIPTLETELSYIACKFCVMDNQAWFNTHLLTN